MAKKPIKTTIASEYEVTSISLDYINSVCAVSIVVTNSSKESYTMVRTVPMSLLLTESNSLLTKMETLI